MFPETHEFLSWADSVPPYSQTAAEGIPNEAYVHTIQNEVCSYFTTYVLFIKLVALRVRTIQNMVKTLTYYYSHK